jgi:hypothetical protein
MHRFLATLEIYELRGCRTGRGSWSYILITAFDKSKITTIQALIIMASPLFTRCDERSLSWLYYRIAFNMIIDLGMHTDVSALPNGCRLSEEDTEVRRRIFWGAYGMLRDSITIYTGFC